MKRILPIFLAALLLLAMTGCRTRTTLVSPERSETGVEETTPPAETPKEDPSDTTLEDPAAQETPSQEAEPDPNAPTEEDPDAQRKEYDSNASAEVSPDADNSLRTEDDEEPGPASDSNAEQTGGQQNEQAEQTVTETVPAEEADQTGVADDAEIADTALFYYQTLLYDRLSSLFECERLYIYWETPEAYRTVFKTSKEHQLILDAGAYDVSAKLLEENLTVDDGWVQRKNPGAIVKVVGANALGYGVSSISAAQIIRSDITSRPGWSDIDAVKSGRVILISEEMLDSQSMRTAAAVYIAKALYPTEFSDIDPQEALALLSQEAIGHAASGTFVYIG
jgi:ABC-type Fe3+-hydroxamate transport system substrate-binding protein